MQSLQAKHDDSIADELLTMFNYYMHELPGPGEEEDDLEARRAAVTGTEQADAGGDDFPVPMPPGSETAAPEEGEGDGLPDLPLGDDAGGEPGAKPDPFADIGLEGEQDAEDLLPEPPRA